MSTFNTLLHDPPHIRDMVAGNGRVNSMTPLTGIAAAGGTVVSEHPWEHVSRQRILAVGLGTAVLLVLFLMSSCSLSTAS